MSHSETDDRGRRRAVPDQPAAIFADTGWEPRAVTRAAAPIPELAGGGSKVIWGWCDHPEERRRIGRHPDAIRQPERAATVSIGVAGPSIAGRLFSIGG